MGFSLRLQELIDIKKIEQKELAEGMNVNPSQVTRWLKLKQSAKPRQATITKIADFFNCNLEWLRSGTGTPFPEVGFKEPRSKIATLRQIPVLGRVPAGIPELAEECIESYVTIPDAPNDSYALKVTGESMEPAISHGDYVLFVIDQDAKHNDVVIVNDEFGDSMIKRLKERSGEYLLVSDNPKYPTYKPNGAYRVMGVVVGGWRPLKL